VNAKKHEGSLKEWILPPNHPVSDIYAIGFQEIVDLNAVNVALNSGNTLQRAQFWRENISDCLNSNSGEVFSFVSEKHLVGLYLVIFVKESLFPLVNDVRATSTGVGIMGLMGNKGAVAIRFRY
jgi:phosphatidylinositol-bisphosphatase